MFRKIAVPALSLTLAAGLAGAQDLPIDLSAELIGNDGAPVGTLTMTEGPHGILMRLSLEAGALEPGWHGVHVHAVGDCSDHAAFQTAGGHMNPGEAEHGFLNPNGPHPSDLPNVFAYQDGTTQAEFFLFGVSIGEGETPLLDEDGAALMIHAGPDDHMTDPSGNSGDRVACGVLGEGG